MRARQRVRSFVRAGSVPFVRVSRAHVRSVVLVRLRSFRPPQAPGLPRCAFCMGAVTPLLVVRGFSPCVNGVGWLVCGSCGGLGVLGWRLRLASLRLGSVGTAVLGGFAPGWVGAQLGAALAGFLAGRLFGWLGPGVGGTRR